MSAVKRDEKGRFASTVRGQRNRLHIRFTDDCFRKVSNLAAEEGSSVAAQVERLVEKGLQAQSPLLTVASASKGVFVTALVGFLGAAIGVVVAIKFGLIAIL